MHSPTIVLIDHHVLSYISQLAGQITRVGSLQSGVGQTLAGSVCGTEVIQHRKTLAKIAANGRFNDLAGRFGHQTAHASELTNLINRTASTRTGHKPNGIEVRLAA